MLYKIYFENGPISPWLVLETRDEVEAKQLFVSAHAQYVYFQVFDDSNTLVSMVCEKR
jgi:hypothetical protein